MKWKDFLTKMKLLLQKMLFWQYPITNVASTVDSSFSVIGCGLFQSNDEGKLDVIDFFTTKEQKLCATYRELIGIVYSLTINEQYNFGYHHFINVLNEHETINSCFTKKRNLPPRIHIA